MTVLGAKEGSQKSTRRDITTALGHACAAFLAAIFLLLNVLATIELDFWQTYFFYDSYKPAEACELSVAGQDTPRWDQFNPTKKETLAIPHPLVTVLPEPPAPYTHAQYHCTFATQNMPKPLGTVNMHVGWIFGDDIRVSINQVERANLHGSDKVIIPLTTRDMQAPSIQLDIDILAKGENFGLRGYAPLVITEGNQKNAKVLGLEIALQQIRYLYGILPVLSISLMFILGWLSGIRSRLVSSLLFYFAMIAVRNAMTLFADIWPWDILKTYVVAKAFYVGAYASFCLLVMEYLRLGVSIIKGGMIGSLVTVLALVAVLAMHGDHAWVVQAVDFLNGAIFPCILLVLVYLGWQELKTGPLDQRRRDKILLLSVVSTYALLTLVDLLLAELGVSIRLSNKVDIIMPLFMGGMVLYALSLIQQKYQSEKAKREMIERDLEVAREIQDSLAPPPSKMYSGDTTVQCYQIKHDKVAGDWMAVRKLPCGDLIAVVADATGKGVQAALVIHAVQSLWADSLDDETFDPEIWMRRVNRTLKRLGETKPHSATLGAVCVSQTAVTYWSAGHLPLFVVQEDGTHENMRALVAKGNVLGINDSIAFEPARLNLTPQQSLHIMLGSDGVFHKGSRSSKRDIASLLRLVSAKGEDALVDCPADDDKTLVIIHRQMPA